MASSEPNFDAMNMQQLRSYLNENNVVVPPSRKLKRELVELAKKHAQEKKQRRKSLAAGEAASAAAGRGRKRRLARGDILSACFGALVCL